MALLNRILFASRMQLFGGLRMIDQRTLSFVAKATSGGLQIRPMPIQHLMVGGMKHKATEYLILRCEHCRFVRVKGLLQVLCSQRPRHNQCEKVPPRFIW